MKGGKGITVDARFISYIIYTPAKYPWLHGNKLHKWEQCLAYYYLKKILLF